MGAFPRRCLKRRFMQEVAPSFPGPSATPALCSPDAADSRALWSSLLPSHPTLPLKFSPFPHHPSSRFLHPALSVPYQEIGRLAGGLSAPSTVNANTSPTPVPCERRPEPTPVRCLPSPFLGAPHCGALSISAYGMKLPLCSGHESLPQGFHSNRCSGWLCPCGEH